MGHLSTVKILLISTFIALIFRSTPAQSANIVFYLGISSYSHRFPTIPLAEALAKKGHNVTFISQYPSKTPLHPKIHEFVPVKLKEWTESWQAVENVFEDRKYLHTMDIWLALAEIGKASCDIVYSDTEFLNWVTSAKVDLVFIDAILNECAYGMAYYWKAKMIIYNTCTAYSWYADSFGLPDETNWIPGLDFNFPLEMSFVERVKNALMPIFWKVIRKWTYFPHLEQVTRKYLGIEELPGFEDIERNVSMVFLNTHYGEEFARSLSPNVISVGGLAWNEKRRPLPKELDAFLERGSGFIYVSFGTYADFGRMDPKTQQVFIRVIRKFSFKIQFVWKVGNESLLKEFPNGNVFISKWMPQQDIVAHPKIKAFILHAGLLGIQEAIYASVPLISFPIFAEQDYNAERIHRKEIGIRLEISTVTDELLDDAIHRILTDSKYSDDMKRTSRMFTDRPQKPLEVALWWTDFVLRHSHEELKILKPSSVWQAWWQKRQLDVWTFIIGAIISPLILILYLLLKLLRCLCVAKGFRKVKID